MITAVEEILEQGRVPAMRPVVSPAHARIGLDIGASKMHGVAATADGTVLAEVLATTPTGGDDVVAAAAEVVAELRSRVGDALDGVVGVGVPGLVDAARGAVKHAVNLGVDDWFPIADRLAERTGARVVVDNDVNAAALGAAQVTGHQDLVYLSLGTGLAAASILDGRLRRGFRSAAGEIGHVPVDPRGRTCQCGQIGCLETAASGSAVAEAWPVSGVAPAQALFDAAAAGDPRARRSGTGSRRGSPTPSGWSASPSTRSTSSSAVVSPRSASGCGSPLPTRSTSRPRRRPSCGRSTCRAGCCCSRATSPSRLSVRRCSREPMDERPAR